MIYSKLFKGTIIGLIAPVAAFVVYVAYCTEVSNPISMYYKLIELDRLTHAISLSALINLLIFFMHIHTGKEGSARGIILATFIYAFLVMILIIF